MTTSTVGTVTTTTNPRQLSDGNTQGTVLGQSAADKIAFWGATPQVQPSGQLQAAITRGNAGGILATLNGAVASPTAVGTLTTAERTMVMMTAAGSDFAIATTDLMFVNKPTSQAGLGVGNVRCSAGNTLAVNFSNFTAATITPTASQSYAAVAIRGFTNTTATLSPAAVAPTTIAEQTFAVPGVRPGELLQVNKPTSQAGLDIVGCRVVASGTIGITFANPTAATITPTASEVYNVVCLAGIDVTDNDLLVQSLQSPAAIANATAAEQTLTVTGLLATDTIVGVSKPTAQAGLVVNGSARVTAANGLGITFANPTAATITPTATETYSVAVKRWNPVAPLIVTANAIAPAAIAPNTAVEQTFTLAAGASLISGAPVWVNKPTATPGLGVAGVRISAANVLAINFCNVTAGTITIPAESYIVGAFQLPFGDASSTWLQTLAAGAQQQSQLGNALRTAMVSLGLIAGA